MSLTALPPSDRSGASPDKSLSLRFLPDRGDLALQVYSLLEKPVICCFRGSSCACRSSITDWLGGFCLVAASKLFCMGVIILLLFAICCCRATSRACFCCRSVFC